MDKPDTTNTQNPSEHTATQETDQSVGHSGKLGLEKPVHIFDNTTLQEAEQQGLIATPEHPGHLEEEGSGLRSKTGILLAGGTLALAALGIGYSMGQEDEPRAGQESVPLVVPEASTTSSVIETTTTTTSPEVIAQSDSVEVERRNGDVVRVPFITDEDIASGEAAYMIKEVASLYMTTGSEDLLDTFVDRNRAISGVEAWQNVREGLGMDGSGLFSPDYALRFDTSDMEVEVLSQNDVSAQIQVSGGLFINEVPAAEEWDEIEEYDQTAINPAIDPSEVFLANFEKQADYWIFTGYTKE